MAKQQVNAKVDNEVDISWTMDINVDINVDIKVDIKGWTRLKYNMGTSSMIPEMGL